MTAPRVGGRPSLATEEVIRAARDLLPDPGRSIGALVAWAGRHGVKVRVLFSPADLAVIRGLRRVLRFRAGQATPGALLDKIRSTTDNSPFWGRCTRSCPTPEAGPCGRGRLGEIPQGRRRKAAFHRPMPTPGVKTMNARTRKSR
ncbi:hypothetical protein SAMN02745898_11781 [Streptomyces sp. 136MFCol5.1]|nr:hypothetical protein SAMN02745898_11781 [Streptomyces sp. 136MFCol5.1]